MRSYYSKAFKSVRLARYILLVAIVLFVIFSITFYKEEITFDNFRYLMKYVEISPPSQAGNGQSFGFSALSSADFAMIKEQLVVVNPKNITSYDINGRKMLNEDVTYKNPKCVSNGKYLLVYDLDGYSLSVYNHFSKVFETKLSTPIEYVYLSKSGAFAVITREKSYAGGVVAYNNRFKKVYSFMTRTATITDVCYDDERNLLACATTDVKDGDFYSEIYTFDTSSKKENYKALVTISGEMPLSMFCAGKNFAVMTDAGIRFYSYTGKEQANVSFGLDTPVSLYCFDDIFAVTQKSALASTSTEATVYDYNGTELFSDGFSSDISHIDVSEDSLYVLSANKVYAYDRVGTQFTETNTAFTTISQEGGFRRVYALDGKKHLIVTSEGAYVVSPEILAEEKEANTEAETEVEVEADRAETQPETQENVPPEQPVDEVEEE